MVLLLLLLFLAAPATSSAQDPAQEASQTESAARAGLDRRQALPPPAPIPPVFSVNGALRGGVQWIVNPPRAKDDVFGFGAFDLVLVGRPTPNVTLLEALSGGATTWIDARICSNSPTRWFVASATRSFLSSSRKRVAPRAVM